VALLRYRNVTQKELARRLGVSEGRVSRILSGRENLTLRTVADIGYALRVRLQVVPFASIEPNGRIDHHHSLPGWSRRLSAPDDSRQGVRDT
jgi:transcriptional regulator with XRE-family HTH domain